MRQAVMKMIIWVLDVIVTVFIGPINRGEERGPSAEKLAEHRKWYALALGGIVLIAITAYTVISRWSNTSI